VLSQNAEQHATPIILKTSTHKFLNKATVKIPY